MGKLLVTKSLLAVLFLMCIASAAISQTSTPPAVLNQFVKLDFDGARLDSDGFKRVFPLTDWPDAPGYDASIIVRGYKVGPPSVTGRKATIMVTYDVVGFIGGNTAWEAYNEKAPTETFKDEVRIRYELLMKNGKWKVHGPNQAPHISIAVALKNEEMLLAEAANGSDEQKSYQQIVNALRKAAK